MLDDNTRMGKPIYSFIPERGKGYTLVIVPSKSLARHYQQWKEPRDEIVSVTDFQGNGVVKTDATTRLMSATNVVFIYPEKYMHRADSKRYRLIRSVMINATAKNIYALITNPVVNKQEGLFTMYRGMFPKIIKNITKTKLTTSRQAVFAGAGQYVGDRDLVSNSTDNFLKLKRIVET